MAISLQYFDYKDKPEHLHVALKSIKDLATQMVNTYSPSAELSAGLRKLLEAFDCVCRAGANPDDVNSIEHVISDFTSWPITKARFEEFVRLYPMFSVDLADIYLSVAGVPERAEIHIRALHLGGSDPRKTILHVTVGDELWSPSASDLEHVRHLFEKACKLLPIVVTPYNVNARLSDVEEDSESRPA